MLERWKAIKAEWPAALRYIGAMLLWSPGNDGACLLIAVLGFLNTFVNRTGGSLEPGIFYMSLSFWIAVVAATLVPLFFIGRRRHEKRHKYLGMGSWTVFPPPIFDHALFLEWGDVFPERPFETNDGYAYQIMVLAVLPAFPIGFVAGGIYFSDAPDHAWWTTKIVCGIAVALVGAGYAWLVTWPKDGILKWSSAWREVYLTPSANGSDLDLVVLSKRNQAETGGILMLRVPWSSVNVFDSGSFRKSFLPTLRPPFDQDWNAVRLTPRVGVPLLVSETLSGEAELYDIVSSLTEKFGPAARARYEQERQRQPAPARPTDASASPPPAAKSDVPRSFD